MIDSLTTSKLQTSRHFMTHEPLTKDETVQPAQVDEWLRFLSFILAHIYKTTARS